MTTSTLDIPPAAGSLENGRLPSCGLTATGLCFAGAAVLLWVATHGLIPWLAARLNAEPVLLWFLSGGIVVFVPMVIAAGVILSREGRLHEPGLWRERLRFRRMNRRDLAIGLAALFAAWTACGLCLAAARQLGEVRLGPSFLHFEPVSAGRYWIFVAWLPFFVLNILAEEILWHGVLLPRQEVSFGKWAWLVSGVGWLLFHVPFGLDILLILWPTTLLIPWVVQRTRNSWTGVVIHAGINGPGFVAAAFGLV